MPRRDIYHTAVRRALENDGWIITHDPMTIALPDMDLFIDLGIERFVGATKGGKKLLSKSNLSDGMTEYPNFMKHWAKHWFMNWL